MTEYGDDELEIELRDSDDIGARIILLSALSIWPDLDDMAERSSWQRWLDAQGVLSVALEPELRIVKEHSGSPLTAPEIDLCDRSMDSLVVLAWACALIDELPALRLAEEEDGLIERIPIPGEPVSQFLDQLIVRDEELIAVERERAELWNWRLVAEALQRNDSSANRHEIEEAIREVVLESAISLAFTEIDTEDFLVEGVPVRKLEEEYLESLIVTSEDRLRALNWLCGLTEWDAVHLPD